MQWLVDGELWLAGVQMDGGGVLGSGGGEKARKRGEWNADVLLMLMRARGGDPGLCSRLATAAVELGWGGVARGGGSSAREGGRRGVWARRVGDHGKQEVTGALHGGGEVVAAELGWGDMARGGGSSTRGGGSRGCGGAT